MITTAATWTLFSFSFNFKKRYTGADGKRERKKQKERERECVRHRHREREGVKHTILDQMVEGEKKPLACVVYERLVCLMRERDDGDVDE